MILISVWLLIYYRLEVRFMASDQVNQDTSLLMNSHHDSTNGIVAHKVEDSNSSRKERRKEWWHKSLKKKRVKLESAEENKVEEKTAGVNTSPDGEIDKKQEPETQRTRLREFLFSHFLRVSEIFVVLLSLVFSFFFFPFSGYTDTTRLMTV